ncbi:MAG TPA: metalloregulator ArsR/SmtB family transcription factor [Aggregatilineales bacterium]|nr:metalloregulator ArsR/SmtB family transcription factor [Aggregatilineales bacterium]
MVVQETNELLEFFKALADANRLKIIGLLAQNEMTVEEMAAILDVRPSTVSHHLSSLAHAGLVSARAESYYNIYSLNVEKLNEMAKRLLSEETLRAQIDDVDLTAYDRQVVENFSDRDGRLKALPAQYKKLMAILRYVVQAFEPGRRYSEKEVNEILAQYHEDTARLRRELVEAGMMRREGGGGEYWLPED